MQNKISVSTEKRYELLDITDKIEKEVTRSQINEGVVLIFTPHSTAGILFSENESGLKEDWISFFKKLVAESDFMHDRIDNNADSHIISGLLGQGRFLLVKNGRITRGRWQQVFLVELDGPRKREVIIKTIKQ